MGGSSPAVASKKSATAATAVSDEFFTELPASVGAINKPDLRADGRMSGFEKAGTRNSSEKCDLATFSNFDAEWIRDQDAD